MHIYDNDLRSFVSDFLLAGNAQSTADNYVAQLKKFREHVEGAITIRAVKDFQSDVQRRSPSVAYMASRAIRAFVKWYAKEYDQTDWSQSIDWCLPKEQKPQRTATEANGMALLATCENDMRGRRDFAILAVFGSTSLRRSEMARMHWSDINWDASTLTVPKSKSKKSRQVHLPREVIRALRRHAIVLDEFKLRNGRHDYEDPWVWESFSCNGPLTPDGITKMVVKRSRRAGVDVTPHSFRRGFAVRWLREGGSEAYLMTAAGWTSSRMVGLYTKAVAEEASITESQRIFGA